MVSKDTDGRFLVTLSESDRKPDFTLSVTSHDTVRQLLDAVKAIGGKVGEFL